MAEDKMKLYKKNELFDKIAHILKIGIDSIWQGNLRKFEERERETDSFFEKRIMFLTTAKCWNCKRLNRRWTIHIRLYFVICEDDEKESRISVGKIVMEWSC